MKTNSNCYGNRGIYEEPFWEEKSIRWGVVVGNALKDSVDHRVKLDILDRRVKSYVSKANAVSAEPATAREYVRALDERKKYVQEKGNENRYGRIILDSCVEVRLTGIESDDVLGEGIILGANFVKGTLTLENSDNESQEISFTKLSHKGRGAARTYLGNALKVDFEVMNADEVHAQLYPVVSSYLL